MYVKCKNFENKTFNNIKNCNEIPYPQTLFTFECGFLYPP